MEKERPAKTERHIERELHRDRQSRGQRDYILKTPTLRGVESESGPPAETPDTHSGHGVKRPSEAPPFLSGR